MTKLENDLAYQTQRADKNEVDFKMAKSKLTNLQKEKEVSHISRANFRILF